MWKERGEGEMAIRGREMGEGDSGGRGGGGRGWRERRKSLSKCLTVPQGEFKGPKNPPKHVNFL